MDEWGIVQYLSTGWTPYQRELIDHVYLHAVIGWDDKDFTGKRWNAAAVRTLGALVKPDETGKYRAILTEAGEEVGKRLKERE